jgi:hypothetical protein
MLATQMSRGELSGATLEAPDNDPASYSVVHCCGAWHTPTATWHSKPPAATQPLSRPRVCLCVNATLCDNGPGVRAHNKTSAKGKHTAVAADIRSWRK